MRRIHYISVLLAMFALLACEHGGESIMTEKDGPTTVTLSLGQTRIYMGEKSGDIYPVYWQADDQISINGTCLDLSSIDADNKACATFTTPASLQYPYHVVYPYMADASAERIEVAFPSEKVYDERLFLPMCGYSKQESDDIKMSHLSLVWHLPMKAYKDGVTLQKIVITSTGDYKISGTFNVDCANSTISPNQDCGNSVTYILPDDFVLSAMTPLSTYISLPACNVGNCTIKFIDSTGGSMVAKWEPSSKPKYGVVCEFKDIVYAPQRSCLLEPLDIEQDDFDVCYDSAFGYVKTVNGEPVEGVAVSDGFTIVTTDADGYYSIDVSSDTWYIYITLPSEYEVPINELGQACFWQKYSSDTPQYDFTLTPLKEGKEKKFALFTFGDPQVSNDASLARFYNEAVPSIKAHYEEVSATIPCYGITLGDIISNGTSSNRGHLRVPMRDGFAVSQVGMPVFHVMGNHDCNFYNSYNPAFPDVRNSTYNIKVQRDHEDVFGPVNYSFNRGDVHIIGMRNIIYTSSTAQSVKLGFMKEQVEWLKQDLALVPKDNTVLFCVHIPMMKDNTLYNTPEVMELLNTFEKMHIISGHRHFVWNYEYANEGSVYTNIYEHVMGAICGAWWKTNMCGDGVPNGYGVFVGEGKDLVDWYHIGYNEGMNKRSHQMRLYRGNAITGAAKAEGDTSATKGYYAFNFSEDTLLANIYFADSKWTIKVYENGEYSGNMTKVPYVRRPLFSTFVGDGSLESPFMPQTATSNDTYVTGLMLGVLGGTDSSSGARDECYHMYQYKLKNKDSEIRVEAIDRFGNIYTETQITDGIDYSITAASK